MTHATETLPTNNVAIIPPSAPHEWSIKQIEATLSRPLPPSCLKQRKVDGNLVDYIPWHTACSILSKYAPGWEWRIVSSEIIQGHSFEVWNKQQEKEITITNPPRFQIVGELAIPAQEGVIRRQTMGSEELSLRGYGDPGSNAESMAFRRAAAKFGLGLYLYLG